MADPTSYSDATDDVTGGPAADRPPATPRWVKVFGIIGIILLILVLLLVIGNLVGLGGAHGPGRHGSSSGGQERPGGSGGPAAAEAATHPIAVTARDTMTFEPSRVTVAAGEMVTFVVTNTGQAVHDFTLGDAAMHQELANARAHGMAHDGPSSIRLQPGETKQLRWRFADAGTLEYACHEPSYYQAGMRGQITIS